MITRRRKHVMPALIAGLTVLLLTGCLTSLEVGRDLNQSIVFIGDSITARWELKHYFGKPFINKGVEGQGAEEIAARFQSDVIALKPDIVVILAGSNNVRAEGDLTLARDSVAEMVRLAHANAIRPIVCTIPPMDGHLDTVRRYNSLLKQDLLLDVTCDYYRALTDENGNPIRGVLHDGLHPSIVGYVRMAMEIARVLNSLP